MQDQPTKLLHWTEQTDNFREISRERYGDEVLTPLRPTFDAALSFDGKKSVPIPYYDGYSLRAWKSAAGLGFEVLSVSGALVSCLVMSDPPTLHSRPYTKVLALHPDTGEWMVEFERCLAWCWLTEVKAD